ncbi:hypothetical protein L3X38_003925 [Prunus dulcis]|uniref:Uncharacterized protein n=1 Tax=Prunus dulcis TaxID=3755 RepID=A0AAD5F2P9_PRUDU|nr:hypothetical protein L3X38_003925 [Prunus dulcis]
MVTPLTNPSCLICRAHYPNLLKRVSRLDLGQRPYVDQQTKRSKRVPNAGLSSDPIDAFISGSSSDRSHHDVLRRVGLATSALLVAVEDIDLDNEPIIPADGEIWRLKFQRLDGKRLVMNKGLLHDAEACDAILGGLLHPKDIKELIDLDDRDIALQQAHHLILIFKEFAKQFRFGWMQGQQPAHHRVVANLNTYDEEMGVGIVDYEFIFG